MPKYGLDQQNFSFNSFSAFVPGWTNFSEQLYATSNFSYKFIFSSGRTVGKFPYFGKPWHVARHFKVTTTMSQSATLYRISQGTFKQFDNPHNKQKFDINTAKSYSIFQGTFMALEYILSKGQSNSTTELINGIYNPKHSLGGQTFDSRTPEEQFEFYESGLFIPYLDTSTISQLNDFIAKISSSDISSKYDAKELNDNGIYPEVWHNDNSPDQAYNERHILDDFEELKNIIKKANEEQDYIFVFVG